MTALANVLTQEELLLMILDLELHNSNPTKKMQILINKLKFQHDHYCEHTPSGAHYEQFRWEVCGKCGVQYK